MTLALIDEAVAAGARLEKACEVLGLSGRTVERWRVEDDGGRDGREMSGEPAGGEEVVARLSDFHVALCFEV